MDHVEFVPRPYRQDDRNSGTQIKINGRDLVELVRAAEMAFAIKENAPSIAGAYAGLPPDIVGPPSRHFLGEPSERFYRHGAKTQVLGCECGEPGCWPLICLIEADHRCVRWSHFGQPHRSGRTARPAWTYDELGPFEFEKGEYERAMQTLAAGRNPGSL